MQQQDILTVCLGNAVITKNEEILAAVAAEMAASFPKATIAAIWRRISDLIPEESILWLREALTE